MERRVKALVLLIVNLFSYQLCCSQLDHDQSDGERGGLGLNATGEQSRFTLPLLLRLPHFHPICTSYIWH